MENPFSLKGKFNRKQLWLTIIIAGVIGLVPDILFPVSQHKIVMSTFGGTGESSITYPVPIEPVTAHSWTMFFAYFLVEIPLIWVVFAAIVKRLHDLQRSGKWMALFFGGLAISLALEVILAHFGAPDLVVGIGGLILGVPAILIGGLGMFMALFVRGDTVPALPRALRN